MGEFVCNCEYLEIIVSTKKKLIKQIKIWEENVVKIENMQTFLSKTKLDTCPFSLLLLKRKNTVCECSYRIFQENNFVEK